jgi:hypothetical protein
VLMNLKRKSAVPLYVVLCYSLLLAMACNNDKTIPLSSDLVDPSQLGRRLQAVTAIAIDSTAHKITNTFGTPNLWLGKFDHFESQILMRFARLDLPDSVSVVAATLKLHARLVQGQGTSFDAAIHEVTSAWDSSKVTWQDDIFQKKLFNSRPMDVQPVKAEKTDSIVFKLDPAVVSTWRTKEGREKGVLIQAPNAAFTKAFHSNFSSPKQPVLELISLKRGNSKNDTTRHSATASVFVFNRLAELGKGRLYVGVSEQHHSVFFFDVTAIPSNATISRAMMTLEVDTLNSAFYFSRLDLQLLQPTKNFDLNPLLFDPLRFSPDSLRTADVDSINATTQKISFAVTSSVQQWVLDSKNNFGLILFPLALPGRDLTRAAFYSKEADPARAPKLQIEYTLPPQ